VTADNTDGIYLLRVRASSPDVTELYSLNGRLTYINLIEIQTRRIYP